VNATVAPAAAAVNLIVTDAAELAGVSFVRPVIPKVEPPPPPAPSRLPPPPPPPPK
jgi:hypothetical protein